VLLLPAAAAGARLLGVEAQPDAPGTRIVLRTDAAARLTEPFSLSAPTRLVLDLPGLANASGRERFEVGSREVARVRLGRHPGFLRVVIDLAPGAEPSAWRIEPGDEGIVLWLGAPDAAAPLPHVSAEPPSVAPPAAPASEPVPRVPAAGSENVEVYGIELQAGADRDRVLVFAEGPLSAEVLTPDATTVLVRLPGATLAASAARRIVPKVGGSVSEVVAFVPLGSTPEVRLQITKSAASEPELSRRGSILAVELPLPSGARDVGLTLSFADAELAEVVREIGRASGERFLFDETLKGRVTVSVANRVSPAEAVEVLLAALLSQGYAAVPTPGGAWRILRAEDAPGAPSRVVGEAGAGGVAPVTTLLRLRTATAQDVVATLARFAGGDTSATAYAPTNSIVLTGSEARVHRYASVAQALDEAETEDFALIVLRHRDAAEIAGILGEIATPREALPGRGPRAPFEVWHDARTNALMLRGPRAQLAELRAWLAQLDVAPEDRGALRVIRPLNADVVALAELLQKLAAGAAPGATQPRSALGLAGRSLRVSVHESTGALVVYADPETQRVVREVVDEIDRQPPTVAVDLLVFELNTSRSLALGFDAFVPFGDVDGSDDSVAVVQVQGTPGGPLVPAAEPGVGVLRYAKAPLLVPIIGPGGIPSVVVVPRETFQVTAAEGTVETRVLLRPHLLALSGEEHELVVGDNVPVLVGATDAAGSPVATDPLTIRNDIERRDVGMLLRVRPTAGQAGDVRLELDVEASRVRPLAPGVAERIGPVIEQRKLTVVTRLETGQVAVLGMLREPITQERERGVPFLRDIPILGWLFRSTLSERMNRQLVIAVEAGIERSPAERVADGIRFRLAFERALARQGSLAQRDGDAYALLVATRASETEAQALASALDGPARVVRWEWDGEERFDVYLGSFARLADAVAASAPLSAAGFRPELVALPPRELARAQPPAARSDR
jgi:general secretion pathway protein D